MTEEQTNSQTPDENRETNPSTQAIEKNDVPYDRFAEVNKKMRGFEGQLQDKEKEIAVLKAKQEEARQETLKKNQEYETLYNETSSELKKTKENYNTMTEELKTYRTNLVEQLPEEKREFTTGMNMATLQKFIATEQVATNAGKHDSSRAGTTAKGEFGGYSSMAEWATKDPAGYKKNNMTTDAQGIRLGYSG